MICEEAAEVLEPQIVACLSKSVEHLILIGDHLQLRPKVQNYYLTMESNQGYDLDKSMFERLIIDENFPIVTLDCQRRMQPLISNVMRETLYPNLKDMDNVKQYPVVNGIIGGVVWLDHKHLEDDSTSSSDETSLTSKSNKFEVQMVTQLARYLVLQGYNNKRVTILTPYLGQLQKIQQELRKYFSLSIDENDKKELKKESVGNEDSDDDESGSDDSDNSHDHNNNNNNEQKSQAKRNRVRLATIDNFQGEESDIIIISLVRSNKECKIGFLKNPNRTNVMFSRAKHAMYVIGNSDCIINSRNCPEMWKQIINYFKRKHMLHNCWTTYCQNHPQKQFRIDEPEQFMEDGGCELPCPKIRPDCDHKCQRKCHPDDQDHTINQCPFPCRQKHQDCGHICPKSCHKPKPCPNCSETVPFLHPQCRHIIQVNCFDAKNRPEVIKCSKKIDVFLPCEHPTMTECSNRNHLQDLRCNQKIRVEFSCGHPDFIYCYKKIDPKIEQCPKCMKEYA